MPITPFHLCPGFFVKALSPRNFNFRIFLLTQFIIDSEALYFILTTQYPLHRFFHTYLGSTIVAMTCVYLGRPLCVWLTRIWNKSAGRIKEFHIRNNEISLRAAFISAFFGCYSQVLLDSIMHRDVMPLHPFSQTNHMLHALNYDQLHLFCIVMGVLGFVIYLVKKCFSRDKFN